MDRLSIPDYWERLERHDWFYPWAEGSEAYVKLVIETKQLFALSRLSWGHAQLYCAFHTAMYADIMMDDDDNVMSLEQPRHNKPEAA